MALCINNAINLTALYIIITLTDLYTPQKSPLSKEY